MGKYNDLDSNPYIQLRSRQLLVLIPKVNNFCISTSPLLLLIRIRYGVSDGRTDRQENNVSYVHMPVYIAPYIKTAITEEKLIHSTQFQFFLQFCDLPSKSLDEAKYVTV